MAKVLEVFDFAGRRRSTYPWNEWTDGRIWQATKDVDFKLTPAKMRNILYAKAAALQQRVLTYIQDDVITFQFVSRDYTADQTPVWAASPTAKSRLPRKTQSSARAN